MRSVRVIIVNFNSARLAIQSAVSVLERAADRFSVDITIVENGSTDDSQDVLGAGLSACAALRGVRLINADRNGGFGAGCNLAIRDSVARGERPDFWWLLNPDTLAVPGNLDCLVAAMDADPKAGIVGGSLSDWRGVTTTACGPDFSPIGELVLAAQMRALETRYSFAIPTWPPPSVRVETDWVCGANMLIRARALKDVSGFDERFFLYYEDADLCRRIRNAGWKVVHEPAGRVIHAVGKSTQIPLLARWPGYFFDSRGRYFLKHCGRWGFLKADVAWIAGWFVRRLRRWWDLGRTVPPFPERFATDLIRSDLKSLFRWKSEPARVTPRGTKQDVGRRSALPGFPDGLPGA